MKKLESRDEARILAKGLNRSEVAKAIGEDGIRKLYYVFNDALFDFNMKAMEDESEDLYFAGVCDGIDWVLNYLELSFREL